jgi:hypothetical protein
MVFNIIFLIVVIFGLLYLDRYMLLEDAKKLEAEVIAEIERAVAKAEAGTKTKVAAALDRLKAKL